MMLWLGDNVYYRNKDFKSMEAKAIKNLYVRNMIAQDFFKSTLHYRIWDDHDYGENNAGNANPQLLKGSLYCKQSFGSISITNGSLQMNIHNNKGEKVIIKEIAFN